MHAFDFDEFDLHAAAQRFRERQTGGDSLCTGCRHSHVYRRRGNPDATIYCHRLERYVPSDIVECSEFRAITALSLSEMADIALHVHPRPGISDGSYP